MGIVVGFLWVVFGVFCIWCGSFQIITGMLPHDFAMKVAEIHGAWVRENVFRLPAIKEWTND